MTHQKAKQVFKLSMQAMRQGKTLTAYDKEQFHKAQAVLRAQRKPAMNPGNRKTLIYAQVDKIYATKKQSHICDAECKAHGHRYFHTFTSKPKMYGLPNGDLLITSRR